VFGLATLAFALTAVLFVAGCASQDYESQLAQLVRELESDETAVPVVRSAVPDAPPPPLSDAAVAETSVAAVVAPPAAPPAAPPMVVPPGDPSPTAPAVPSAPADVGAPAPGAIREMTIHPDCLLQINVAEDPSLNASYPVNADGAVELNYIGPVSVMGKTEREAAEKIRSVLLDRYFRTASVKVRIVRAAYGSVSITGAVRKPGAFKLGAGDTISLNDALLRVGGLQPSAQGGKVRVYRGGMQFALLEMAPREEYDLAESDGRPAIPDVSLANNDVAILLTPVAASEPPGAATQAGEKDILVLGEVSRPGFYKFDAGDACTMMHLLFKVGTLPTWADTKKVRVLRRDETGIELEHKIDVQKLLKFGRPEDDYPLEHGDRVIFMERSWTWL
jgi:protein involved in polysaccharide export with SLBB domain/outer membrane murein-binding lipoprotein Lpp